jgi:16S rRNA (cytidine1402-2'-O)-methyltransferase
MIDINKNKRPGQLYVVATPIGNRDDITYRAVTILKQAAIIACEDTRHSKKLLHYYGIDSKLTAYHEFNEVQKTPYLLEQVKQGQAVALISDAGTPLISDPGLTLIQKAHQAQLKVVAIHGACALTAALSIAGLDNRSFHFEGFLAAKPGARQKRLQQLESYPETLVFYEAPHRIEATLAAMFMSLGESRQAILARELTKYHEQLARGSLKELYQQLQQGRIPIQGEFVIAVAGKAKEETDEKSVHISAEKLLLTLLPQLPLPQAVKLTAQISGLSKNKLYKQALAWKEGRDE